MMNYRLHLPVLLTLLLSSHLFAQNSKKRQFIQVTREVSWSDGMRCQVGEVELVTGFNKDTYTVWNGKNYLIYRTHAKKITSDEAALALLRQRQQLYTQLQRLMSQRSQAKNNQNRQPTAQEQLAILQQLQKIANGTGRTKNDLALLNQFQKPSHTGRKAVESQISGEFKGWGGDTIFKLTNGQIWQQSSYAYNYHYAYRPEVIIYNTTAGYKMKVDGVDSTIYVKRIK